MYKYIVIDIDICIQTDREAASHQLRNAALDGTQKDIMIWCCVIKMIAKSSMQ